MSEPSILLCGPALDAAQSAASLDLLRQVSLPNSAKFLITTGKFDAEGAAKILNVEADYPAEPAYLQTMLRWADGGGLTDRRFRDGYDLYCLRRVLARHGKFEHAVLLRAGALALETRWAELSGRVAGRLFFTFDDGSPAASAEGPSLLIDLRDERTGAFLEAAWQLYLTGTVYGIAYYSFDRVLDMTLEALELEQSLLTQKRRTEADTDPLADEAEALVSSEAQ